MVGEVVLSNEFLGDVGEAAVGVFWTIGWQSQVEVADFKGAEFGAAAR